MVKKVKFEITNIFSRIVLSKYSSKIRRIQMFLTFVKKRLCLKGITFAGTKEFSDTVSVPFQTSKRELFQNHLPALIQSTFLQGALS